jgi:hypothetical protein
MWCAAVGYPSKDANGRELQSQPSLFQERKSSWNCLHLRNKMRCQLILVVHTVVAMSFSFANSHLISLFAVAVAIAGLNGFHGPSQKDFRNSPPLNLHRLSSLLRESIQSPESRRLTNFSPAPTAMRFLACFITWRGSSVTWRSSRVR